MNKTSSEIFSQYEALQKSLKYLDEYNKNGSITALLQSKRKIIFIGCGSSYSISKSAEKTLRRYGNSDVYAFPAGDILVNTEEYLMVFDDALIIVPSRSGQTSEIILAIEKIREKMDVAVLSISMVKDSPIGNLSEMALEFPWAFDESVCQTRNVTNLYTILLYMVGLLTSQPSMLDEIKQMVDFGPSFMTKFSDQIKSIAERDWNHVVVLADGVVEGIAEEGALAFKEICQLPSNHYNLLDSRHGPSVLFNKNTLIIFFLSDPEDELQMNLLRDYLKKGSVTVVTGSGADIAVADLCIPLPKVKHREVLGIPFIFIPQLLSLEKALKLGVDPDNPEDLTPWIKLQD